MVPHATDTFRDLPTPLAELAVRLFEADSNYVNQLLRLAESIVRYLVALGLARTASYDPRWREECASILPLLVKPSLGTRIQVLQRLEARWPGVTGIEFKGELPEAVSLVSSTPTARSRAQAAPSLAAALNALTELRNAIDHHRDDPANRRGAAIALRDTVIGFANRCPMLAMDVIVPRTVTLPDAAGPQFTAWSLRGPARTAFRGGMTIAAADGVAVRPALAYLSVGDGELVPLDPLLVVEDDLCFVLDEIRPPREVVVTRPLDGRRPRADCVTEAVEDLLPGWKELPRTIFDLASAARSRQPTLQTNPGLLFEAGIHTAPVVRLSEDSPLTPGVSDVNADDPATGGLFGGFILRRLLGESSSSRVFLAESRREGERGMVTLKVLRTRYLESAWHRACLRDEAFIGAHLNHPNIAQVREHIEVRGIPAVVREHVEGVSLLDVLRWLAQTGRQPPKPSVAVAIVVGVLRGLAAVHAATYDDGVSMGIVHRALAPQDVLLSGKGEVKLIDLGLAAHDRQEIQVPPDALVGCLGYMSPEQVSGGSLDARSDLYSAGVVLWETLSCQRAYDDRDVRTRLARLREARLPSIRTICPTVSPELDAALRRALSFHPDARLPTAHHLERALLEAVPEARHVGSDILSSLVAHAVADTDMSRVGDSGGFRRHGEK